MMTRPSVHEKDDLDATCILVTPIDRSPFGDRRDCGRCRRRYDGGGGCRGSRRGGVQQGLSRRLRRRRGYRGILMRGVRLFQGSL